MHLSEKHKDRRTGSDRIATVDDRTARKMTGRCSKWIRISKTGQEKGGDVD